MDLTDKGDCADGGWEDGCGGFLLPDIDADAAPPSQPQPRERKTSQRPGVSRSGVRRVRKIWKSACGSSRPQISAFFVLKQKYARQILECLEGHAW